MPFKSEAQRKKMIQLEKEGKVPQGTVAKWDKETESRKLPERVGAGRKTAKVIR